MITGRLVDAAGNPCKPFITGYTSMNEAYLDLQELWPVVAERNHNSMTLADQQGCRLILQERKA
jgi:isopentenyl diphosphate isomerase/L-lactate dehydrogenase-like FMN-dependent dehydrogenase